MTVLPIAVILVTVIEHGRVQFEKENKNVLLKANLVVLFNLRTESVPLKISKLLIYISTVRSTQSTQYSVRNSVFSLTDQGLFSHRSHITEPSFNKPITPSTDSNLATLADRYLY
jgi:hypothetical protein